ncbi:MAG: hypothetical protein FWD75_03715 [Propionibacteriaceae bacterium]|nr:hypothetical protein [Propionibacteriaceae bacterium]
MTLTQSPDRIDSIRHDTSAPRGAGVRDQRRAIIADTAESTTHTRLTSEYSGSSDSFDHTTIPDGRPRANTPVPHLVGIVESDT